MRHGGATAGVKYTILASTWFTGKCNPKLMDGWMDGQIDNRHCRKGQLYHSLNVLEGDLRRVLGADGEDVHLKSGETKSCVIFQLGTETLLNNILTAL